MTKDLLNAKSPQVIKKPSTSSVELGQWYWISDPEKSDREEWLGCIMKIGSNYAKLESPHHHRKGHYSIRILFTDFFQRCRLEPNASAVI
jgi:hypothetical protein